MDYYSLTELDPSSINC